MTVTTGLALIVAVELEFLAAMLRPLFDYAFRPSIRFEAFVTQQPTYSRVIEKVEVIDIVC